MEQQESKNAQESKGVEQSKPICGIIMPISSIEGCTKDHWVEVKGILSEAIKAANFNPCLVSDADDSGVIQKRIVQNIYDNDIIVCDVSCKNPNVMFELGMRLAFDKPTIIVIDDKTNYTFDTSVIEHLTYPRDLRYYSILDFQKKLKDKIIATSSRSKDDPNYTTFLKNFGEFEVAHIEKKKGSLDQAILMRLDELSFQVSKMQKQKVSLSTINPLPLQKEIDKKNLKSILRNEIESFCKEKGIKDESDLHTSERENDFYLLFDRVVANPNVLSITNNNLQMVLDTLKDTIYPF